MKTGTLFLQLTAGALFLGLLVLIVSSKFLVNDEGSGPETGKRRHSSAARRPEDKSRVLFTSVDNCLLVLAPLQLEPGRQAFDSRWLIDTLGAHAADESFLALHLFGRGVKSGFRYDPSRMRVELELEGAESRRDVSLADRVAALNIGEGDRLLLRTMVPEKPVDLPADGLAKVLLSFPTKDAWSRLVAATLSRPGGQPLRFRPTEISQLAWESLLSGGPIPEPPFSSVNRDLNPPGRRRE